MISVSEAYRYCEKIAKSHYENFPVGSLLIPKAQRPAVWSLYAFARQADDFADENYPKRKDFYDLALWREEIRKGEAGRFTQLKEWEDQLKLCYEGHPTHPIFVALKQTIADFKIPQNLLSDLLHAFRMDVEKRRYPSWEDLIDYSRYSANPIGRLILMIFAYRDEKLFDLSDAICTGLQLANFWQDIATDLEKDRIYIPQDLLQKYRIKEEEMFHAESSAAWKELLGELGEKTLYFFKKGAALPFYVKGRLSWELKCTWLGGMTILKRACFDPKRQGLIRPRLKTGDKFLILYRSFFLREPE